MEYVELIKQLKARKYKPIYMLMGEETYFRDQILEIIENDILDEPSRAFGQTVVWGRDVTMDQVIALAKSFPMMGDKQVVVVREAQDMAEFKSRGDKAEKKEKTDDPKKAKKKPEPNFLELYIENPTPSTILVFSFSNDGPDKRLKFMKTVLNVGILFKSTPVKDYQLAEWIDTYVKSRQLKIESSAAQMLAENLGADLSKVVNAINKLTIIVPEGGSITARMVEENIGISKDYNLWELTKALSKKNVLHANRIIHYFEANPKSNPLQLIIPGLYGHFAKLAIFISLPNKANAAADMGLNPYAINEYREAAKHYSAMKVERIISSILEADRRSKGVGPHMEGGDILKELVFKILH
jgi:DNA polymerase III subunit delta